jgi:hypothetical protein
MDRVKWKDVKEHCPWRMIPLSREKYDDRFRCAAIEHTHVCCSESMCAPWYFIEQVEKIYGQGERRVNFE